MHRHQRVYPEQGWANPGHERRTKQSKKEGNAKQLKADLEELKKKVRYVKNFPKDLKYLSLFPNNELAEEAKAHQLRIMEKI